MNMWSMVLQGMREEPSETQLEYLFYGAIREHRDVKEDIGHYDRLEEGSGGDRSYTFLYDCVSRAVRIQRLRKNRQDQSRALTGEKDLLPDDDLRVDNVPAAAARQQDKVGQNKTLCSFYQQGNCDRGKDCRYSHDIPDNERTGNDQKRKSRQKQDK